MTTKAISHGLSRVAISDLRYGTTKGAFLSGFVSSGFSIGEGAGYKGAIVMSIVGGTVSEIGGGKFSNGAWGSLFQYMFNEMMDPRLWSAGRAMGGTGGISDAQASQNSDILKWTVGGLTALYTVPLDLIEGVGTAFYYTATRGAEFMGDMYYSATGWALANPETVTVTIETLDGYYGGSSPGYNAGSFTAGFENATGINIVPDWLKP